MFSGITRLITHKRAGVFAGAIAIGLAGALAVTTLQARAREDFLRARIAALASHDAAQLEAELVSCRATVKTYATELTNATASQPRPGLHAGVEVASTAGDRNKLAAQLVSSPPQGFDVCARMESADRAVMKTLDRK